MLHKKKKGGKNATEKSEKETIILFNESEDEASIYTYNAGLKTRLKKFSRQYPQLCHLKEKNKYGGVEYLIDKSRLSIHFQSPYSEERIENVDNYLYPFSSKIVPNVKKALKPETERDSKNPTPKLDLEPE